MPNFSAGDFSEVTVVDPDGSVRAIRPRSGVFATDNPAEISALRSLGLNERTDAQVEAAKARRSTQTRSEAGKTSEKVVDLATGEGDTRGPGAPADEPVKEV